MRNPFSLSDIKKHPLYADALAKLEERESVVPMPPEALDREARFLIADMMGIAYKRPEQWPQPDDPEAWRDSIGAEFVVCMICGERMKLLTKAHLRKHGGDKAEYRRHFRIPFDVPLACDELLEERRRAMSINKIWKYKKDRSLMAGKKEKTEKLESDNFDELFGLD